MPLLEELAFAVRQRRQDVGWSQQELAEAAGLSRATVNALESGKLGDLSAKRVERLANELGLAVGLVGARRAKEHSALEAAARTASVSYATELPAGLLLEALRDATVAPGFVPHLRTLLQEAPVALLAGIADELAEKHGIERPLAWRRMRSLAAALKCDRALWRASPT